MMPSTSGQKGAGVAMDAGGDCIGEEGRAPCKGELTSCTSELEEGLSYFQVILNSGHLC